MHDPYRPTTFDHIVGQPTDQIAALLDGPATPNFLFHGPPGTGKTTTAHVIARRLHDGDPELLVLNASDDRGIDTVRETVIPATRTGTLTGAPRVILLDEMEAMTKDAQQALRAPMENGHAVFVLTGNDDSAIHSALRSRCQVFEFDRVDDAAVRTRIEQVLDAHDGTLSDDEVADVVRAACGDVRQAMQLVDRRTAAGTDDGSDPLTDERVTKVQQFLSGN